MGLREYSATSGGLTDEQKAVYWAGIAAASWNLHRLNKNELELSTADDDIEGAMRALACDCLAEFAMRAKLIPTSGRYTDDFRRTFRREAS